MANRFFRLIILLLYIFCNGCNKSDSSETRTEAQSMMSRATPTFRLTVAYMPGARPSVGQLPNGFSVWSITELNLEKIVAPSVRRVEVPTRLEDMKQLDLRPRVVWKKEELLNIAIRQEFIQKAGVNSAVVLYLSGRYEKGDHLGLHFENTSVIFIFKSVIDNIPQSATLRSYIEQTTVVHELGHFAGLVNRGVPLTSAHEDLGQTHHCSNQNCVMYHRVSGSRTLVTFSNQIMTRGRSSIFGNECLQDLAEFY